MATERPDRDRILADAVALQAEPGALRPRRRELGLVHYPTHPERQGPKRVVGCLFAFDMGVGIGGVARIADESELLPLRNGCTFHPQRHGYGILLEVTVGDDFRPSVADGDVVSGAVGGRWIREQQVAVRVGGNLVFLLAVVPVLHGAVGHGTYRLTVNAPVRVLHSAPAGNDLRPGSGSL